MYAICFAKIKNNIFKIIHIFIKKLLKICFICFILLYSFLAYISEKIGKSNAKIGQIIIIGIPIILK
jgi:hypothetical protein